LTSGSHDDDICKAALAKVHKEIGGFFEYAFYDDCIYRNGLLSLEANNKNAGDISGALNDYPCGGGTYRYGRLFKKERGPARSDFFEVDNAEGDFDYTPTEPDFCNPFTNMSMGS
jgi:hypothetical protein